MKIRSLPWVTTVDGFFFKGIQNASGVLVAKSGQFFVGAARGSFTTPAHH